MSKVSMYDDLKNQPNQKIEAIKKILPDCFDKDGNLIEGSLKEVLTNNFEKPDTERFTFNWAGKQKAREIAYKTYIEGTLKFDKERSKNFDTTQNLIIEGDNLQVLKLLKNSYKGKVKCIYIDPPYNTGQDFVYNDKFELDIEKYLIETGEIDEETGEQLTDYIQKDNGKKHSKWLSFMCPRLMVARELLREDGVIFISIDDNEVHHLRLLMNEVFGEEEFVCEFPRITKRGGKSSDYFAQNHDYVLAYTKDIEKSEFFRLLHNDDKFNNKDEFFEERGYYKLNQTLDYDSLGYVKSLDYPIEIEGKTYYAGGSFEEYQKRQSGHHGRADWGWRWRWSKKLFEFGYKSSFIVVKETKNGSRIYTKTYQNATIKKGKNDYEVIHENRTKAMSTLAFCNDFSNDNSKSEVSELIGDGMFDYPKPVSLIKHLLQISTAPNDLILDFFAGSGTTGQAIMELNQEEIDKQAKDGMFEDKTAEVGGRKFILVQLPEKINDKKEAFKAGYKKISDITIERVKRAGEKYKSVDNGFKVLQLADNPDRQNLWNLGNLNDNKFILTHLALLYGYGLNYKFEKIAEKEIYIMKSEIEKTKDAIVIMEQKALTMDDILSLIKQYGKGKYKFFSRDSALNIELTYNLLQHFKEDNVIVF